MVQGSVEASCQSLVPGPAAPEPRTPNPQKSMSTHRLLIKCRDEVGLVSRITGTLARHQCNIVANGEFVAEEEGLFFMRTEFEGDIDREALEQEVAAQLPEGAMVRMPAPRTPKIVVFATREAHCLGDLLIRWTFGDLRADIQAVISNRDSLRALTERFDLPFHHISSEGIEREAHEARVLEVLREYQPDYLVLAKYMRILTGGFVEHYPQRIVNIHHSFLPAFIGARPYHQAYERGVKIIGATAHFVTADLDEGPIIEQGVIRVDHTHTAAAMARSGRDVEKTVLAQALQRVLEDRVMVSGCKTIIFD